MYRLISESSRSLLQNNFKLLSIQKHNFEKNQTIFTNRLVYPRNLNRNVAKVNQEFKRHQSNTSASEAIKPKKRRRKLNFTKYIELLEVTNKSTKQTRTKVQKLKANKLTDFINVSESNAKTNKKINATSQIKRYQPIEYQKINLEMFDSSALQSGMYDERPLIFFGRDKIHTIQNPNDVKEILASFQNFKEIIDTIEQEANVDEEHLDLGVSHKSEKDNSKIYDIDAIEVPEIIDPSKTSKTKEHRFKSKFHRSAEHENLAKQKALTLNLIAYLNVCVTNNMLNRGLTTLFTYRQKYKKFGNKPNVLGIEIYNILLHGYAEKGNFVKIEEICNILNEDQINYNAQTYAAILECLGRLEPAESNVELVKKYLEKANDMGITANMIMDQSKFLYDQREIVLDAIQRVDKNFEPIYTPPIITYSNTLVNSLNEHIRDINDNQINDDITKKSKNVFTREQLQVFTKEQLEIELEGSLTIKSIEKLKDFDNVEQCRKKIDELNVSWRSQIRAAFTRDLNTLRAQLRYKPIGSMSYYTYLKSLDSNQCADILIKEIRMLAEGSETYSPTVGQLYKELGRKVQARYQIEQKKRNGILEKTGDIYSFYCDEIENCKTNYNLRQIWQKIVHENRSTGPNMDICDTVWPIGVTIGVGRFLYNILMRDIKIDTNIMRSNSKTQNSLPAFYTLFRNQGRLVKEEVKPHPVLSRLLRGSRQQTLTFDANLVPMLCPPQPWSTPVNGGYLLTKSELIRLPHQAIQQWARINEADSQQLYPALDSLNQLGSIPWKVNTDVLDVILEVFNNGGDAKLDVPQPPASLPPLRSSQSIDNKLSNKERYELFRQKLGHRRKQAEMYSLWCDTLYRLSLANHYRNKVFWLPHNMDFRGRVYPVPPHLNHLGSDLARSILVFHQEQPLGPDGFNWLKLHCINLTGLKKRESLRERLLYAEAIMDDIIDSADNPLTGRQWWTTSDEPWQTLACCKEIAKVARSSNLEKYMSRFPIHQDGSCNGLQHYAALGRDKAGAVSVNLAPSNIPQDVYSAVANLVEKTRKSDATNGLHVAQILDGYVRRKVIKQTVMTTVYGVTRYGARLQIAKQLKDIDDFPKEWVWPASTYLTTKTFESLREMFTSAKEIQDWFTDCARFISTVCNQNVEWVTPLGLPVVQPYNRSDQKNFSKNLQHVNENMSTDMYEKPNVMKQKNAFPPNFIHSLDSSHMMLTSLHCERQGITFISVHDCFWTHANSVPDMNKICREQFVSLHSQPILEDLSKFLVNKYSFNEKVFLNDGSSADLTKRKLNKTLKQLPEKGSFDLNKVLQSIYFFS